MKTIITLVFSLLLVLFAIAQPPQGFNYQAVVRNTEGEPLQNQTIGLRISLLDNQDSPYYSETHSHTTNSQGLVSIVVGNGQDATGNISDVPWSAGGIQIKVEVDPEGDSSYDLLGVSTIQSVPYAMYALAGNEGEPGSDGQDGVGIQTITHNLNGTLTIALTDGSEYTTEDITGPLGPQGEPGIPIAWLGEFSEYPGSPSLNEAFYHQNEGNSYIWDGNSWQIMTQDGMDGEMGPEGPLVDGSEAQTLYHDGSSWVANSNIFNTGDLVGIGTVTPTEKLEVAGSIKAQRIFVKEGGDDEELLFAVRNTEGKIVLGVYERGVKINVDDTGTKGRRGGFAVGGLSDQTKEEPIEYLRVTPDSVRINFKQSTQTKGRRGGFAVGGLSDQTKTLTQSNLFYISPDSARIYVDADPTKGTRGGFAVGGLSDQTKTGPANFFSVSPNADDIISPSEPRILWYPLKNAFLAGQVLIENATDVGENSMAIGYENKAAGNYSQALGYQSQALGNYSTAVGKNATAETENTFAFGDGANAKKLDSYAFGSGAIADGVGSFAFGSYGRDTATYAPNTNPTIAAGDYSFAFGLGSQATGLTSTALGIMTNSEGNASMAIGIGSYALGEKSLALNSGRAIGHNSLAFGYFSKAEGANSIAIGRGTSKNGGIFNHAFGAYSIALGFSRANGAWSIGIGSSTVNGDNSYGLGHSVTVDGDYAVGIGVGINAYSYRSVVVGSNNIISGDPNTWSIDNPVFVVGNGSAGIDSNAMTILWNGNVGIGTFQPDKLLHVSGDARIEGDIYYGTGSGTYTKPDFVFSNNYDKNYQIEDVERFIETNNHLPWLTPASEEEDGVNLTRMQFETLETVENLQLQIIQMNKKHQEEINKQQLIIEQQQKQIKHLEEKNNEFQTLKAEIEAIKSALKK